MRKVCVLPTACRNPVLESVHEYLSLFPSLPSLHFSFPPTHQPIHFLFSRHHPPCFLSTLSHLLPHPCPNFPLPPLSLSTPLFFLLLCSSPKLSSPHLLPAFNPSLPLTPSPPLPLLLLPSCLPSSLTTTPPLRLPWLPLSPAPLASHLAHSLSNPLFPQTFPLPSSSPHLSSP